MQGFSAVSRSHARQPWHVSLLSMGTPLQVLLVCCSGGTRSGCSIGSTRFRLSRFSCVGSPFVAGEWCSLLIRYEFFEGYVVFGAVDSDVSA